ncbi:MAG: TonB-dependent receptor [Muribaculaceae bacterium]|nr:TonB-dependent receptor [Muribaculaceae bacterium]
MRKLIGVILLLLTAFAAPAAVKIGGKVVDAADGKPIDNVLCCVTRGKGAPLTYIFTDRDGRFSLEAERTDSVAFSLIGYAKLTMQVGDVGRDATIRLSAAEFALKEIVVKAPPIRENGDTLVYDVNSFKSKDDRYISDVLKKLPGVTVGENGSIKYQGKAINKFYIEGRDLLEGRYTLASNNLDVNAVKKVEVIEHNQHIKSLQGLEPSERAAINLKLDKQFMVRPFGEVRGGIGNGPVYDAGLLVTLLTRGPQALVSLQANNYGKNLEGEAADKFEYSDLNTYISPYSTLLSTPTIRSINIPLQRYLFNRSRLASVNLLLPAGKNSELKLNAVYVADRMRQRYDMSSSMMLGEGNTLNLFENAMAHTRLDELKLAGIYERNAAKLYLKDEFGFLSDREGGRSEMLTQSDSVDYSSTGYPREVYNKLRTHYRFSSSQLVSLSSHIRAGLAPERLEALFPSVAGSRVGERFRMKHFKAKNYLTTSLPLLRHRIGVGAFMNYTRMQPRFTVSAEGVEIPAEVLPASDGAASTITNVEYGAETNVAFQWLDETLYLKITPEVRGYNVRASVGGVKHHTVKFLPSVSMSWKLNSRLEMRMGGNRRFSYQDESPFFPAPYMTDYRSVYVPSGDLNHTDTYSAYYSASYRHSVKLLFANMSLRYSNRKSNFISSAYYTSDWSCITTSRLPNRGYSWELQGEVSKTFADAKTTVKLAPSVSYIGRDVAQQGLLSRNYHTLYAWYLTVTNRSVAWLYARYSLTGSLTHSRSRVFGNSELTNWFHTVDLSFFPLPKFTVDLKGELSTLDNYTSGHDNYFFCDFGLTYSLKRWSLALTARNIFDVKDYSLSQYTSVNESTRRLPLRGREIMLTVKVKF